MAPNSTVKTVALEPENELLRAKHLVELTLINMLDVLHYNHRMDLAEPILTALAEIALIDEDDPVILGLQARPRIN